MLLLKKLKHHQQYLFRLLLDLLPQFHQLLLLLNNLVLKLVKLKHLILKD